MTRIYMDKNEPEEITNALKDSGAEVVTTQLEEHLSEIEQTTLGQLTETVEYYHKLQEEKKRIEMSLEVAKKSIIEAFKLTGMREYETPTGIKAWINTRASQRISVKEARELLDEDSFNKLLKESMSVVLTVRQLKQEE